MNTDLTSYFMNRVISFQADGIWYKLEFSKMFQGDGIQSYRKINSYWIELNQFKFESLIVVSK